ncbi:MAG: hypothetical protein OEU36_12270 [Gammaproteobacteria bacterium]|nr:hypothetical protein [Gammaproteobacteria bacterium]
MKDSSVEGLWSVEIMTQQGPFGIGVLGFIKQRVFGDFFESGRLLGGDTHYYYSGTYHIENYGLSASLLITHYADDKYPIFGSDDTCEISITATLDHHTNRDVIELSARTKNGVNDPLIIRIIRRVAAT